MLQQEFIGGTDSCPYRLAKVELASLFSSELPTAGGVRAGPRGEGSCEEGSCTGWWGGGPDRSLQTSSVKGQIVNTSRLTSHMASVAATHPAATPQKQPSVSVNERDCAPVKPRLRP